MIHLCAFRVSSTRPEDTDRFHVLAPTMDRPLSVATGILGPARGKVVPSRQMPAAASGGEREVSWATSQGRWPLTEKVKDLRPILLEQARADSAG